MPLDKSRIQGFGGGPPTEESWWSSSGPAPKVYIKRCPQGHELQPWAAKPGWCDGCGAKIKSGEAVMDCRECNYYLCKYCCPPPEATEDTPSFWGAMASLTEMGSGPAVSSALDNVALSLGDVIDAATQDISEMASDFKSFVASAVGLEDESGDEAEAERQKAAAMKKSIASVSPRSRQEAASAISDFCQKYPAARVRPNSQELDKLWAKIHELKPIALTSAFYDELSFTNGDTSWQPRLRVLYAMEYLYKKHPTGKEVAMSVMGQAKGIIQHLTEVQQCAEKATEVMKLITGRVKEKQDDGAKADEEEAAKKEKPIAKPAKAAPAPDLLDMSDPPAAAAAPAATPAPSLSDVDLLGGPPQGSSLPQDLDLLSPAPAAAAPLSLGAGAIPFTASASLPGSTSLLLGMPSSGPKAATLPLFPPSSGASSAYGGGLGQPMGPMAPMAPMTAAKAPYIPSVLETTPKQKDPFSFVSDLTGIGDTATAS